MRSVMTVYGTRPEAIKMAPIVEALQASAVLEPVVVVTGQHREMLDQVNSLFGIVPDHDLDVFAQGQGLTAVTTKTLERLEAVLESVRPDAVVVQGDTTSAFSAALAAFYQQIPVFHVEAGLRTDDRWSPFPEELNRRLATQLASLHLAPTTISRDNLLHDGVRANDIVVTGNTVIDALIATVGKQVPSSTPELAVLAQDDRPVVLVTTHRRESWGEPMHAVGRAVARLADQEPGVIFVLPLHKNPLVRDAMVPPLQGRPNVIITEPLHYAEFAQLINRSTIVLTDSGGVQEEAPSLGKPVLVMRENTERPEAVTAGTVRLIGTDEEAVVDAVSELLHDEAAYARMANAVNPYGDGLAARRSIAAMEEFFGAGSRLPDFEAAATTAGPSR